MSDLTLYTHPMSRGRIIRWQLEEMGVPYRAEVVDYGPAMKSVAYLAINPMGKVPALRHAGVVVTECAAICAYLADAFPAAGLAPAPSSTERGAYYRWLFFAAGPLEQATTAKSMGWSTPGDREGMVGFGTLATTLDTLEAALAGKAFVAGDRFSAADIYVGSHLGWGMQFGSIDKRPVFEAYWARLAARPAHIKATAIDDALMKDHPVPGM